MLDRDLVLELFRAFSIQRWNDRIRPTPLIEMDKHAHKMIAAFLLGRYEEAFAGRTIDWPYVIYGGVFALLKNIVLSDIKAPIHEEIRRDPKLKQELDVWVIDQWRPHLTDALQQRFESFLMESDSQAVRNHSFRVLRAAHKYTTLREFQIIKPVNQGSPGLTEIESQLKKSLADHLDLVGLREIVAEQSLFQVMCHVEQLRYQVRWSQTERLPPTSVLGHSMLVATMLLFLSEEKSACPKRLYNNFFCGLFHDLPEALTRDIISPVKRATPALPQAISRIEARVMSRQLLPFLHEDVAEDIMYFTQDEFSNKIRPNGQSEPVQDDSVFDSYNEDAFCPLDGKLVKLADDAAALLEAHVSLRTGVRSRDLVGGRDAIVIKYTTAASPFVNGVRVADFFEGFRHHDQ